MLFKNTTIKAQLLLQVAKPFEVLFIFVVKISVYYFKLNKLSCLKKQINKEKYEKNRAFYRFINCYCILCEQ